MKYFFIMNPGSKGGKSRKSFEKLFHHLERENIQYDHKITKDLSDAFSFSVAANKRGYDVIIAVGGDGTINGVLNGFFDSNGKRVSEAAFGVIYTGTSPDFCKSYNIPVDFESAVLTMLANKREKIRVGKLTFCTENKVERINRSIEFCPERSVRFFGCCANIGLGASLARRANSGMRKYLGDFMGTFVSLIVTLLRYRANHFILFKDGKEVVVDRLYNISIGRTRYIASGIKVHNTINTGEERFYSLLVRDITLSGLPGIISKIYSGKEIKNNKFISLEYLNTIEISGNFQNPEVEMDGDPVGYLPCRIEMAEDPLDLIVG